MKDNFLQIGIFVAVIVATFIAVYLVRRFFTRLIKHSSEELQSDPTNYQFLKHVSSGVIYLFGFGIAIYSIPSLRAIANTMLAGAGVLAVAIGFASQHALSNLIGGIFIIIFKPFRVNDRLKIKELTGVVEDITLRHTVIRDFENKRIIIPNAIISNEVVINSDFGDGKICRWIDIGISYDSDVDIAKEIMREAVLDHLLHIDPRTAKQIEEGIPKVIVRVISLGNFAVQIRAWAWTKDVADGFVLSCDLNETIKKRFKAAGIEIPYPHQTIIMKNDNLNS